jgi:hypothetical protein
VEDERSEGLHKRSAEDCGTPLVRARSRAPQEGLVSLLGAERIRSLFGVLLVVRVGVAGREPGCYKTEYGDSGKVADEKPTYQY